MNHEYADTFFLNITEHVVKIASHMRREGSAVEQ
jgi:hypothetical protein